MPYDKLEDFRQDYEVAQNGAAAVHGNINQTKPVPVDVAWKLYQNARKPDLDFHIFGRHITGQKAKSLQDFRNEKGKTAQLPKELQGITKSQLDQHEKNFGYVNDGSSGSILMMGGNKWNFTVNDSWVLGGVHSGLPFYAASPITKANILDKKYYLSITGRELLGLALAGYKEEKGHPALGTVYVCADKKKAAALRLTDYQAAVAEIVSKKAAEAAFKKAGFKLS
jgi:hypothetical protein